MAVCGLKPRYTHSITVANRLQIRQKTPANRQRHPSSLHHSPINSKPAKLPKVNHVCAISDMVSFISMLCDLIKPMTNREAAIEFFLNLGAHVAPRQIDGRAVLGVQLRNCAVSDGDLCRLAELADELDVVGLEGSQVTDIGLNELTNLPKLDNVDLTNTAVTDAGLLILAQIPTLEFVHVEQTNVTKSGIAKLQSSLPDCEIVSDF